MEGGGKAVERGGRPGRPRLGGFFTQFRLEGGEVMPGSIRNTAVTCKQIFSVADPDTGSGAFLPLDPGSGSGMINPDHRYFRELRNQFFGLKYLNYLMRIRDGKRDKHPGSATLPIFIFFNVSHPKSFACRFKASQSSESEKLTKITSTAEHDWKK